MPENKAEIDSYDQHLKRNLGQNISDDIKAYCRTKKIDYYTWPNSKTLQEFLSETQSKVILVFSLYDMIPDLLFWTQINQVCQQQGRRLFLVCDNIFDKNFNDSELANINFFSKPKLLGVTAVYQGISFDTHAPTRLFNCFIQRVDSVRQSWFYFLHNKKLLDKGYVSFLLRQYESYFPDGRPLSELELFDYIHHQYQLNRLPHFQDAYTALRPNIPYRNFQESHNLVDVILDSKYSLVLETVATEDDKGRWSLTEKLLRALQLPTINLFFAQKGTGGHLKKLGFEIEDMMLHIDNKKWIDRQRLLLDILEHDKMAFIPVTKEKAAHNKNLLEKWKDEIIKPVFFQDIFAQIDDL